MTTLNSYANRKQKYFIGDEVYIGKDLPFSSILNFEKEKGKIIFFSNFQIATETFFIAQRTAVRFIPITNFNKNGLFSVLFTIKINNNNNISNAIIIEGSFNKVEIILLPFSFYLLKDVQIDYNNYSCDILLENIGKNEILEEKIKFGKTIKCNKEKNIMEVE